MSNTIHIAYRSSDFFAEQVTASIASILYNTKRNCRFYVFGHNLGDNQKQKMLSLKNNFPELNLEFVDFYDYPYPDEIDFDKVPLHPYWQLFAPWVFNDMDKLLIMCGDTVIESDVGELWDMELGKNYFALAPEYITFNLDNSKELERRKLLGIQNGKTQFNFGVVLCSLSNIRQDYTLVELYKDIINKKKVFDEKGLRWVLAQDYVNTLRHRVLELHPQWNFGAGYCEWNDVPNDCFDKWIQAYKSPKVIHYVYGSDKPAFLANINIRCRFIDRYFNYKAMTPYADIVRDKARLEKYDFLLTGTRKGFFIRELWAEHIKAYHIPMLQDFAKFMLEFPFNKPKLAVWGRGFYLKPLLIELKMQGIEPDIVVDGLPSNQGQQIFKWTLENAEILNGKSSEYGVIVATTNPRADIAQTLDAYGYGNNEWRYAFSLEDSLGQNLTVANDWHHLVKWQ